MKECNFYVVAVPTPVDANNRPDLTHLVGSSPIVGKVISNGDLSVLKHKFDAVILAVAHNKFKEINLRDFLKNDNDEDYDVKGFANREQIDGRL